MNTTKFSQLKFAFFKHYHILYILYIHTIDYIYIYQYREKDKKLDR